MIRRIYDIEDRLIRFANQILDLSEKLPNNISIITLTKQLIRSGTSPALNYGEAQAAESDKDFIHKMKISLKELRETQICLKILRLRKHMPEQEIVKSLDECSQLVA